MSIKKAIIVIRGYLFHKGYMGNIVLVSIGNEEEGSIQGASNKNVEKVLNKKDIILDFRKDKIILSKEKEVRKADYNIDEKVNFQKEVISVVYV